MRTHTRSTALVLAAVLALTAAGVPPFGGRAAATDRVVVDLGETLSQLAARYGVSVEELTQLNGLADPDRILAGQQLLIPPEPAVPRATETPLPAPEPVIHHVVGGDTLSGIAIHYGTSVAAIARANGLADASFIRIGQPLTIPGPMTAARVSAGPMPAPMATLVARRQGIAQLILGEAQQLGVPPALALAVAWQESGWQTGVVSAAGAVGVMQLLPSTGEWIAEVMLGAPVNVWDPASNVRAGVRLLAHYLDRYGGDRALALAAYYQGQAATDRHGVYAVSRPYIASVLELERMFSG